MPPPPFLSRGKSCAANQTRTLTTPARHRTELLRQAEKRRADLATPAALQSNAALAEPVQIPGLRYLGIQITGGAFEKFVLSQLSWLSFL